MFGDKLVLTCSRPSSTDGLASSLSGTEGRSTMTVPPNSVRLEGSGAVSPKTSNSDGASALLAVRAQGASRVLETATATATAAASVQLDGRVKIVLNAWCGCQSEPMEMATPRAFDVSFPSHTCPRHTTTAQPMARPNAALPGAVSSAAHGRGRSLVGAFAPPEVPARDTRRNVLLGDPAVTASVSAPSVGPVSRARRRRSSPMCSRSSMNLQAERCTGSNLPAGRTLVSVLNCSVFRATPSR